MNAHAITTSNTALKIIACIFGYALWSLTSQTHLISVTLPVPVSFYNTTKTMILSAPDHLYFELQGTRKALNSLDMTTLSVHIDASRLQEGIQSVPVTNSTVFLPPHICLLNYTPSNSTIQLSYTTHSD